MNNSNKVLIGPALQVYKVLGERPAFRRVDCVRCSKRCSFRFLLDAERGQPKRRLSQRLFLLERFGQPNQILTRCRRFSVLVCRPIFHLLGKQLKAVILAHGLLRYLLGKACCRCSVPKLENGVSAACVHKILTAVVIFRCSLLEKFLARHIADDIRTCRVIP